MMNFHIQGRSCHAERSEASLYPSRETLRCAQGDNTVPMLVVKVHYRGTKACPCHDDHTTISGYAIAGAQPPQAALLAVFPGYPVKPLILLSASA